MRIFKIIFWIIWRIWFYVLVLVPIIAMFPLLIYSISTEKRYPFFFKLAQLWAKFILYGMGFYYKVEKEQQLIPGKSYMLIANHTSMTDVMLMLAVIDNPFVFVGKKELARIPLFGFFYKRTCILVDRGNAKSRLEVYGRAQKRLNQGLSICIFPEGLVPEEHIILNEFKDGAFRLAIEHQIPIVPMTFFDNKERLSYTFFSGSMGVMRVKVHQFIETSFLDLVSKKSIKDKAYNLILHDLEEDMKKKSPK